MKRKLFLLTFLFSIVCLFGQTTTHNILWGFNSNPNASGDLNSSRTIEVGDTVIWTWDATGSHNVVSDAGSQESFDSGNTESAPATFSYTFMEEGINDYVCEPHSGFMVGTITVVADGSLSTQDFIKNINFSLSPNPASSFVKIDLKSGITNAKVEAYNVLGKRIISKPIFKISNELDISDWDSGIYLVRVSDGEVSQTKRLVKQ